MYCMDATKQHNTSIANELKPFQTMSDYRGQLQAPAGFERKKGMEWKRAYSQRSSWKSNAVRPSEFVLEKQRAVDTWRGSEFPIFGQTTTLKYRRYNRLCVNLFYYVPILLAYPFVIFCLCNIVGKINEALDVVVIVLLIISYLVGFNIILLPHVLSFFSARQVLKERLENALEKLPFLVEDFVLLVGIFVLCLMLIRRVIAGPCPQGTTLFDLQGCNPFASTQGIASDLLFFTFIAPIAYQVVIKNVSLIALCMSWITIIATSIFCVVFTRAWADVFVLCLLAAVMNISFEVERMYRISYMQLVSSQEQEKRTAKRTELQLLAEQKLMEERNEKKLRESETFQLRSLMGNVAHDLKTPLVAFNGDVDLLKLFFSALSRTAIREASAKLCVNGELTIKPREIFRSLRSTSHFMLAAINRGQDYMKATNGVKLVPANGTFELANTLEMAARCAKQLFSEGRRLIMHPLPTNLCAHIISDSHWLLENLLCLISNAVKYSDSGDCDVRFELVCLPNAVSSPFVREDSVVALESPRLADPITPIGNADSAVTNGSRDITHHIKITVEDHGIGIDVEKRSSLFGIFRQAQRSTGGTGLGLFSLHERVKALGGSCGVESRRDGRLLPTHHHHLDHPQSITFHSSWPYASLTYHRHPSGEQGSEFWLCFPYRPDVTAAALLLQPTISTRRLLSGESLESLESLEHWESVELPNTPVSLSAVPDIPSGPVIPDTRTTAMIPTSATPAATAGDGLLSPPLSVDLPCVPVLGSSSKKVESAAKCILLTDDAPTILKVVSRLLVSHGYLVETANNGNQSLEKLKKGYLTGKYDMLLTDVQMPIMDGIECTKRFRAWETDERSKQEAASKQETAGGQGLTDILLPIRPRFLIIGFSANSDADTRNESLAAGMDYFVQKPFNFIEFENLLILHWGKEKA